MKTALVTGGAGFIGSHLVEALLHEGHRVRVLDDFSTGHEENLAGLDVELLQGDVRAVEVVAQAMKDVDWVFHQAARVSVPASMEDPTTTYEVNLMGTLHLLEAAKEGKAERVVVASSAAVYGETTGRVEETTPVQPQSPYATSKLAMEHAALMFARAYHLPAVALRYFNVYGPRQSVDSPYSAAIPIFIQRMLDGKPPEIHGDGKQTRDFVYVEEVTRANLLAATKEEAVGQVFNIGGGGCISILELVQILQRLIPKSPPAEFVPPRWGDIRFSEADIERARRALGYRAEIDVEQGLQRTVQWFQARRSQ
jgi:UDP-glucose 4-epimerase